MEIVQERLEREFSLDLIASAPSVEYHVKLLHGRGEVAIDNPSLLPNPADVEVLEEPWVNLSVVTPSSYIGPLMELSTNRRGLFQNMEYLDPTRVVLHFEMPLAELIVDYFDQLKSPSQAAIGSHVVARESVRAMRKNVLAKCYGGDITRKRKLLEKQKEGKQRMKRVGSVEIPQEAFLAMLRMGDA